MVDRYPTYGSHFYDYKGADVSATYNPSNHSAFPVAPARRDTFVVAPQGYWVARFRADNPGGKSIAKHAHYLSIGRSRVHSLVLPLPH